MNNNDYYLENGIYTKKKTIEIEISIENFSSWPITVKESSISQDIIKEEMDVNLEINKRNKKIIIWIRDTKTASSGNSSTPHAGTIKIMKPEDDLGKNNKRGLDIYVKNNSNPESHLPKTVNISNDTVNVGLDIGNIAGKEFDMIWYSNENSYNQKRLLIQGLHKIINAGYTDIEVRSKRSQDKELCDSINKNLSEYKKKKGIK